MRERVWCLLLLAVVLFVGGKATAQNDLGNMPPSMSLGRHAVGGILNPVLMAGCSVDLDTLGLGKEVRGEVEEKRFSMQKRVIQLLAERQIQQLELTRMLSRKNFDLTLAQKEVGAVSVTDSKIRNDHVEYLHYLAGVLNEDQWQQLLESAPSTAATGPRTDAVPPCVEHGLAGQSAEP